MGASELAEIKRVAALSLESLKEAVYNYVDSRPHGARNVDVATELGLKSYRGRPDTQRNMLSQTILWMLENEGRVMQKPVSADSKKMVWVVRGRVPAAGSETDVELGSCAGKDIWCGADSPEKGDEPQVEDAVACKFVVMTEDALASCGEEWRDVLLVAMPSPHVPLPASEFFAMDNPKGFYPVYAGSGILYVLRRADTGEELDFTLYGWDVRDA